jgi:hypothetical protein
VKGCDGEQTEEPARSSQREAPRATLEKFLRGFNENATLDNGVLAKATRTKSASAQ